MTVLDILLGRTRFTLTEGQRAIITRKGRLHAILGAGEHSIPRKHVAEHHDLHDPVFDSDLDDAIWRERRDLAAAHLTEFRTGADQVAILSRDGRVYDVLHPDQKLVVWTDAGSWDVTLVDLSKGLHIAPAIAGRLQRAQHLRSMRLVEVPDAHIGLVTIDNGKTEMMQAGNHWLWSVGNQIRAKVIDLRWRAHDVTGHEILTKDRVTLRVNLTAAFRVTDPMKAVTAVRDFEDALHRALGLAFRKILGAMTLDSLLADKMAVDTEAAQTVRSKMAAIGLEVGEIALKDVILPGEMRDILTGVVAAQKEAEANVIRRREETNATRSLLNTAKVMAENPVMLRLKELEALEAIAGKVERLTVHSGTDGLLNDIARLRD